MTAVRGAAVGVDAGATATAVAAWCDGAYATARGEPASPTVAGVAAAADAIASAVLRAVGVRTDLAVLFVGAAGAGRPGVAAGLRDALGRRFPTTAIEVEDDLRIALRAAVPAEDAAIVIAGTGAVAYAEHGLRRTVAGGEGYALGDTGSGFWIGRAAAQTLLRALDGRAVLGTLAETIQDVTGADTREVLLERCYDGSRVNVAWIATLAPHVLALADAGEAVASGIADEAATALAELALAVTSRAGLPADAHVALGGGLLSGDAFRERVERRLLDGLPSASVVRQPFGMRAEFAALEFAIALPSQDARP